MYKAADNAMKRRTKAENVVAYLRTSSAANVGADKDSEKRQRSAIEAFARSAGYEIVDSYYDEAVSGADPVTSRSGFAAMMERIAANGVRTIIVETANRFARDLIVQETGYTMLKERDIELIAADKPDAFLDDTPTANLIRQVLGAVSQFEKAMVVTKLKGARDRKRATGVKVEGRKNYGEINSGWLLSPRSSGAIRSKEGGGHCVRSRTNSPRPVTCRVLAPPTRRLLSQG